MPLHTHIVSLLLGAMALLGASAPEKLDCQDQLVQAARYIDNRQPETAERILRDTQQECKGSGYWWFLHGWSKHLRSQDGRADWAAAMDLYTVSPQEVVHGSLEVLIQQRMYDSFDFDGLFSFPLYTCMCQLDATPLVRMHAQIVEAFARNVRSKDTVFSELDGPELRALVSMAVADFAKKSLKQGMPKHLRKTAGQFQAAVDGIGGASGSAALAEFYHGTSSSISQLNSKTGPFLRGLLLVSGTDRVCLKSPRPDSFRTWEHGPAGETLQILVSAGTLLLFHRSLRPRQCSDASDEGQSANAPQWLGFNVWTRSPATEDAGIQEGELKFFGVQSFPKELASALRKVWSVGNVTNLWPWHARVVRYHYDRHDRLLLKDLFKNRAVGNESSSFVEVPISCPSAHSRILEMESFADVKLKLLNASAQFLSWRMGQQFIPSDLDISSSVVCQLSQNLPKQRLEGSAGSGALLRAVYVASPEDVDPDPQQPLAIRLEVLPQAIDLGVHSEGFDRAISWPFAITPNPLSPRVPPGGVALVPSSTRLSILPFEERSASMGMVLVADVSVKRSSVEPSCPSQPSSVPRSVQNARTQDAVDEHAMELFPTKVHVRRLHGVKQLNSQIKKLVLKAAENEVGANLSNVGGWQSVADWLMTTDAKCLGELRNEFADAIMMSLMSEMPKATAADLDLRITGWANANYPGHSNALHHHSDLDWRISGAYIVDTGGGGNNSTLRFWDPRPITSFGAFWRALEGEHLSELRAVPGLLILFPSWLEHFVLPHLGNRPRITISFNVAAYWRNKASQQLVEDWPKSWARHSSAVSGRRIHQEVSSAWHSTVFHRWSANVMDVAEHVRQRHDGGVDEQQANLVCDDAMFKYERDVCSHPTAALDICGEVLSAARSTLCNVAQRGCNAAAQWNLQARSRGTARATTYGPSAGAGLAASRRHRFDALLWVVVVLRVTSQFSHSAHSNATAAVKFNDPRASGRNFEHLWANRSHSKSEVLIRPGVVIAFPPWLSTEVFVSSNHRGLAGQLTVDVLAFDIYASRIPDRTVV